MTDEQDQARSARESARWRDALEEIARNAETLLAGGLPHFSRKEFAETVAHCARHALGSVPSTASVLIRVMLRFKDARVEYEDLASHVKLDDKGHPPLTLRYQNPDRTIAKLRAHYFKRTIDGRFIYDEV